MDSGVDWITNSFGVCFVVYRFAHGVGESFNHRTEYYTRIGTDDMCAYVVTFSMY